MGVFILSYMVVMYFYKTISSVESNVVNSLGKTAPEYCISVSDFIVYLFSTLKLKENKTFCRPV